MRGQAAWDYFASHGPLVYEDEHYRFDLSGNWHFKPDEKSMARGYPDPMLRVQHFYDTTRTVDIAGNIDGEDQEIWDRYGY